MRHRVQQRQIRTHNHCIVLLSAAERCLILRNHHFNQERTMYAGLVHSAARLPQAMSVHLGKARTIWIATGTPIAIALFMWLVAWLLSLDVEQYALYTGGLLELAGICTVALGLRDTRTLFERPPSAKLSAIGSQPSHAGGNITMFRSAVPPWPCNLWLPKQTGR